MMILRRLAGNSRGDTIVEVLLAIVVVSATLGGAFAAMNRGVQGTRASQERAEALKLVESQVEYFKAGLAEAVSSRMLSHGGAFCLGVLGDVIELKEAFTSPGTVGAFETQPMSDYSDTCKAGSIPGGYNLSIQQDDPTKDPGVFTFRARWINVGGDHRDQIEIKYKVSP